MVFCQNVNGFSWTVVMVVIQGVICGGSACMLLSTPTLSGMTVKQITPILMGKNMLIN